MKFLVVLASLLVSLVAGQASVGSLPQCAIGCVSSGISATGCSAVDVHCFCTASAFLKTVAPCIFANCSVADQQLTETTAQGICNAANPPVQLPSFSSLLNQTSSSAISSASSSLSSMASAMSSASATGSSGASAVASSAGTAAATSATSASGRIEGDTRAMMAVAAMVGVVAVAFFAV